MEIFLGGRGWGVLGVIDLVLFLTNLAKPLINLAVFREAAKNIQGGRICGG